MAREVGHDQLSLLCIDDGPGPCNEMVGRLFEPFATARVKGVGLGLYIARELAVLNGGSLSYETLDSQLEQGSGGFVLLVKRFIESKVEL